MRQWYPREFLFVLVLSLLLFLSLALSPLVLPLGMLVHVLCWIARALRRSDGELVVVRVSNVGIGRQRVGRLRLPRSYPLR